MQAVPFVEAAAAICANAPPKIPLHDQEKDALTTAVALVVHKYGGQIDPWFGLALVLGAIGIPRFMIYREMKKREDANGDTKRKPGDPVPEQKSA